MRLTPRLALAALVAATSIALPTALLGLASRRNAADALAPRSVRGDEDAPGAVRAGPTPSAGDGGASPSSSAVDLNRRANALAAEGRVEEALAVLRRAERMEPGLAPTHYNRGRILHRLGRYDEALAAYDRALALRGDYAKALTNRAIILARGADPSAGEEIKRALADLTRAIELAPRRTAAYYQRAKLRLRRGATTAEREAARADLDRLLTLDPADAGAHLLRAEAAEALGDVASAKADRERARELRRETNEPQSTQSMQRREEQSHQ